MAIPSHHPHPEPHRHGEAHADHPHHHHGSASTQIADGLRLAEEHCRLNGLRLTAQRRSVLEALIAAGRPCGAYDLIEAVRTREGRGPAPIAIYRALDFLKEHGFIHRLESLNAFIACPHQHDTTARVVFLICESCRQVEEAVAAPLNRSLADVAMAHGFAAKRQIVELAGTCRMCTATPRAEVSPGGAP